MTNILLGVIIGLLIRDIKFYTINKVDQIKKYLEEYHVTETKFFEPVSEEEKFKNAQSIDDLIEK